MTESNQDLFNEDDPIITPTEETVVEDKPSQPDLFTDKLSEIKNEDGKPKYDTVPKALDALVHSQSHITNLEKSFEDQSQELEALKVKVAQNEAVEDVVARLTANKDDKVPVTPQSNIVDESAVLKLVKQALDTEKVEASKTANYAAVTQVLTEKFGEKAKEVVNEKVKELRTTHAELKKLSSDNPQLVLALFGGSSTNGSPTSSSINMPSSVTDSNEIVKPTKSLLAGATSKEQSAFMKQIQEKVYKEHDIKI